MAEGGGEDKMAESRKEKEKINDSLKDSEKQNSTSSRKKEKEEEEKESTMSSLERGINKLSINNPTTDHQSLDCPTLQQQLGENTEYREPYSIVVILLCIVYKRVTSFLYTKLQFYCSLNTLHFNLSKGIISI